MCAQITRAIACLWPLCLLAGLAQPTLGQTRAHGFGPALEIRVDGQADPITLPFRTVNNHVLIDVRANGSDPVTVILDTGMPIEALMLYETPQIEALGLPYGEMRAQVGGAGGDGKRREAKIAPGIEVGLGPLTLGNMTALVMEPIPHFYGYHDGVIGAALFNHFVVRLDQDEQHVELYRPESFRPAEGAIEVPLEQNGGLPYVEAEVVVAAGGPAVPVRLVVDIGASHAVSLNVTEEGPITAPARTLRTVLGKGVSGEIQGNVGRIAEFRIGGKTLKGVVATFPDAEHQHPRGMDSRDGNLGSGILRRFNLAFDYSRNRMWLEPNRHYTEAFDWDMSGIRLRADGEALRVDAVLPDSPAAAAGIQVDDVITGIDGEAISASAQFELRERFRSEEGSKIEIELLRDGQKLERTVKLKRMV